MVSVAALSFCSRLSLPVMRGAMCACSLVLAAKAGFAQPLPLSLNLDAAYADTRAAMLAGDADILCIGDSLTARPGAYFPFFSSRLRSRYGDGGEGYRAISPWTGGTFDPNWSFGYINTDNWPYRSLDGMWAGIVTPTPTLGVISRFGPFARIYYQTQPLGGTFSIERFNRPMTYVGTNALAEGTASIDLDIDDMAPFGMRIRPYFTRVHAELQRPTSEGPFIVYGAHWSSGQPGVRVHRAANGGWGVDNFIRRGPSFTHILQDINPDLIIIMLGQNDGRYVPSLYASRYSELLNRLQAEVPGAEIVIVTTYRSNINEVANLAPAIFGVAQQRGLGFINLRDAGGPYQSYVDRGYLDPDMLHFNDAGGRFVANLIFDALETGGASLASPCNDIDFNNNNVFPEDQDVIDFFDVLAGGTCPTATGVQPGCDSIDFNRNGVYPEDQDIIDFFNVLAGAPC
ncbi:MAG TPA: SGNH/GDSL hydrolase family protein [Phycisphaerales bacterium]|nr:SGNH/GDSL hydrolase family protein [Phycisphaerales bacterium]